MRIENQGLSLWYGTPDAPGPGTVIPAGAEVPITVGMSPADASNKVDVRYRINGGAVESLSAHGSATAATLSTSPHACHRS